MSHPCNRRTFLSSAITAAAASLLPAAPLAIWAAGGGLELGPARDFSFEHLVARARQRAAAPYREAYRPAPPVVEQIDYDAHGKLRFKPAAALFADGAAAYPITFFHLGRFFPKKVAMFALDGDRAAEILYRPGYFEMPADSVAHQLPADAGFAGFRVQESRHRADWPTQDWAAFLGASYFRTIGALGQYGLSARGIAVDTAASGPEEFPDFVEFYLAPAEREADPVLVYALLDGPSVAGAYCFRLWRTEGVLMEVDARLFLRREIERLGIAPATSMFWFGEGNPGSGDDWRPEVHDSDGLAMWNGGGERLWRPLNNPPATVASSFLDENPRGFGLLQRDRDFEHFLDGVNYERRPSLWIEPLHAWGRGAVQLIEIPTDDEIHDNIVAFWVPAEPARAGAALEYRYRLHWLADEPYPAEVARCVASRGGRGGEPGRPRPADLRKFVVEFAGRPLAGLGPEAGVEPVIDASRGEIANAFTEPVPNTARWRIQFDLRRADSEPVELRAYLRLGGEPLTETWLYQLA